MLIVSKFRDYYDHAVAYGVDNTIVYNRKEVVHDEQIITEIDNIKFENFNSEGFVLVCGQVFPFYLTHNTDKHIFDPEYEEPEEAPHGKRYKTVSWNKFMGIKNRDCLINLSKQFTTIPFDNMMDINYRYQSPVLVISPILGKPNRYMVISDPDSLRSIGFTKQMDSTMLFQEISQFVATLDQTEMVEINDKEKTLKHGFDKQSFRKRK